MVNNDSRTNLKVEVDRIFNVPYLIRPRESMHKLAVDFSQITKQMKTPTKEDRTLAREIKKLSDDQLKFFNTVRFGFIRKFFSSLHNLVTLWTFTSSAKLSADLAAKILTQPDPEAIKSVGSVSTELPPQGKNLLVDLMKRLGVQTFEKVDRYDNVYNVRLEKAMTGVVSKFWTTLVNVKVKQVFRIELITEKHKSEVSFPEGAITFEASNIPMIPKKFKGTQSLQEISFGEQIVYLKINGESYNLRYDKFNEFINLIKF